MVKERRRPKLKVKKGDQVVVLAGKDKGRSGRNLARAAARQSRVVVCRGEHGEASPAPDPDQPRWDR